MPRASRSSPGNLSAVVDDDEPELDRAAVPPEALEEDLDDLDDEDEDDGPALVLVAPPRPPPLLAAVVPLAPQADRPTSRRPVHEDGPSERSSELGTRYGSTCFRNCTSAFASASFSPLVAAHDGIAVPGRPLRIVSW